MKQIVRLALLTALTLAAACQSKSNPPLNVDNTALKVMERVALGANRCWFKSDDEAFTAYRMAPELNSFSGRPRILLVDKNRPEALPLLVVEAEGVPAKVDSYGPLMETGLAPRISSDVSRWANGQDICR